MYTYMEISQKQHGLTMLWMNGGIMAFISIEADGTIHTCVQRFHGAGKFAPLMAVEIGGTISGVI